MRVAQTLLVLGVVSACSSGTDSSTPTLGLPWAQGERGYGAIEPEEIFNGGVSTGHVFDIEWESWGGATATGHGTGYFAPPGSGSSAATEEPASVVAFDLGACDGQRAYRQVRWFFPERGESIDLDGDPWLDACTGP